MRSLVANVDRSAKIVLVATMGATLLLAVAVWVFVVAPKRSQAADLGAKIAAAQQQLAAQRSSRAPLTGISPAEVRDLGFAMPDGTQMPSLVRQLDRFARLAGVTLDTVTPQPETGGAGYKSIPLSVVVDGKFFGIRKFLSLLRNGVRVRGSEVHGTGRLFDVQAIDFQQSTDTRPDVRATLTLQAFAFAGGAGTATAASASAAGVGG